MKDPKKEPLLVRFKQLLHLVNKARAERNPFTASALKKQIEPQIEPMALEAAKKLHELENRCIDLQKQLSRLDIRLNQYEV